MRLATVHLLSFALFIEPSTAGERSKSRPAADPPGEEAVCPHITAKKAEIKTNPNALVDARSFSSPGTVDGAAHPEMVPDDVAFRLFMRSLTAGHDDPQADRRARTKLRQIGFDEKEIAALVGLANHYVARASVVNQRVRGRGNPEQVRDRFRSLARELQDSLQSRLSEAGREKLQKHLETDVKRRVRIVPQGNGGPE